VSVPIVPVTVHIVVLPQRSCLRPRIGRSRDFNRSWWHCCVVGWCARLFAAVHSSDGEDEFGEGLRDPMPRIDFGGQFVMTAVEIMDERRGPR
jgi:hypothetical protein